VNPPASVLAGLRDIHPPPPVPWWPPAPGWWALLGLAAVFAAGAFWAWTRYRRGAPARAARRELAGLRARRSGRDDGCAIAAELSTLLRRYALARFPRGEVAGLTGEAWLEFLDRTGGGGAFARGPGRALLSAPYRRAPEQDTEPLLGLAERWIRRAHSFAGRSG